MTNTGPMPPPPPDPSAPQPGSLGIKEKRSWATWQFICAIVVAAFIGMAIGHSGGGSSGAAGGAGGGATSRTLPPDNAGAGASTDTTITGDAGSGTTIVGASGPSGSTDTTIAGVSGASGSSGASGPSGASGATTTTAPAGPPTYLIHNLQGTGPTNLPAFTIAGGQWQIGWAYRCVLAPNGAAKFQIAAGATNAVDEQGREGNGTTPQSAAGPQSLKIVTDPACQWAVTVTGVAG